MQDKNECSACSGLQVAGTCRTLQAERMHSGCQSPVTQSTYQQTHCAMRFSALVRTAPLQEEACAYLESPSSAFALYLSSRLLCLRLNSFMLFRCPIEGGTLVSRLLAASTR